MMDFFSRFFRRDGSSATAKERLRLVLLSDHLSLAPEVVDALKNELIEVLSRYVKIDSRMCDVSFEQQNSTVAMHANIPILGLMSDRPTIAAPVIQDAPRGAKPGEPGYLDAIHDEVRKSGSHAGYKAVDAAESAAGAGDDDQRSVLNSTSGPRA